MIEFDPHHFLNVKLGVHVTQAVFIFVAWAIEIAVFKSSATVDGRAGWYFGLCFLTIPAILYETMCPRFPRTRRFANPYALAIVDGIFMIMWLSAFAAVASWNGTGKCGSGCNLSKAVVAFGVLTWLLFILTTFLSLYALFYYRREGYLPGTSRAPMNAQMIDPDKEAFSTTPHDEYAPVHNQDDHEIPDYSGSERYEQSASSYMPPSVQEEDTSYTGYSGALQLQQTHSDRIHFPPARYDNI